MSKKENKEQLENVEFYSEELDKGKDNPQSVQKVDVNETIRDYDKDIVDILPKVENKVKDNAPLLNENDIVDIIDATKFEKINEQVKPVSNLIKKDDLKAKEVLEPVDFKENFSKSHNLSEDDWREISNDVKNNEALSDEFQDFVELPKISGDRVNFVGRQLISSEYIKSDRKTVKISDTLDEDESQHNTTSIEINRTENGDIESISVYCKCGEVTNIRFDYEEGATEHTDSEYIKTSNDIEPLNLPNIETE